MRFPQEIVADTVVPAIRCLLAQRLHDRGWNQDGIAGTLGVSQSAVSKYLTGGFTPDARLSEHPRLLETVDHVAEGLAEDRITRVQALGELMALVRAFETRGPICTIHEERMPELQGLGCDLCIDPGASRVLEEQEVLADVQQAVRLLTSHPGFARLVPHVGSNVAMTRRDARTLTEVAAVPGGLVEIQGSVRAPVDAAFGASRHVAEVALAVVQVDPERRAVVNVATGDDVLEALTEQGLGLLEVAPEHERDQETLAAALQEAGGVPDVLYHRGGFGIEPITYITGTTAMEAARRVVELARDLRER